MSHSSAMDDTELLDRLVAELRATVKNGTTEDGEIDTFAEYLDRVLANWAKVILNAYGVKEIEDE